MAIIGEELSFNSKARRGRCFGYVLNLAAKAILFGNNIKAFDFRATAF
jgi:hypothetical protein